MEWILIPAGPILELFHNHQTPQASFWSTRIHKRFCSLAYCIIANIILISLELSIHIINIDHIDYVTIYDSSYLPLWLVQLIRECTPVERSRRQQVKFTTPCIAVVSSIKIYFRCIGLWATPAAIERVRWATSGYLSSPLFAIMVINFNVWGQFIFVGIEAYCATSIRIRVTIFCDCCVVPCSGWRLGEITSSRHLVGYAHF